MEFLKYHLAYCLGKDVETIEQMEMDEIVDWIAYSKISPFNNIWQTNAVLCSLICNLMGNKSKPEDFLPKEEKVVGSSYFKEYFSGAQWQQYAKK